jgi:hypothetical protein
MEKIKQFIKKNKLSFDEGSRNSTVVTLIGYSQHLGLDKVILISVIDSISTDPFFEEEVNRLWDYCNSRNYKNYWSTPAAKKSWKF